jgi:hypothetical protein
MGVLRRVVACVGLLVAVAACVRSDSERVNASPCPSESSRLRVADAAKACADFAQAAFQRAQTAELVHRGSRSVFERFIEDYATGLAAIAAGLVGLVGLLNTLSAGQRQERSTQLYEAAKRFSDKDSAAARASAAELLSLCGRPTWGERVQQMALRWKATPNFYVAINQLATGMTMENDERVIRATINALVSLSWFYPIPVLDALFRIAYDRQSLVARFGARPDARILADNLCIPIEVAKYYCTEYLPIQLPPPASGTAHVPSDDRLGRERREAYIALVIQIIVRARSRQLARSSAAP